MAINKDTLLKFAKSTELPIKLIEDDSSDTTEVKILHLTQPINAVGSIPTPDGGEMRVSGSKIHVGAENIEELLKDCEEKDGLLVYKGPMHLDVSKPQGRTVNGQFTVTKPARIWLTKVKFSKSGGQLRSTQVTNLNGLLSKMFKGGQVLDLAAETTGALATNAEGTGEEEPEVVVNQGAKVEKN